MRPCRSRSVAVAVASLAVALSSPISATVNHGDYLGSGVDFIAVSETTATAGDPEPIWGAPTLSVTGTQLLFSPPSFISSCTGSGTSDTTVSTLTTTIQSQPGVHIEVLSLQEAGDAILNSFPPFGTAATNASAAISGTLTVIEDISGPIAPVVIPFTGSFTPSNAFALPTNFGSSGWTGSIQVDVASSVPNATKAQLSLTNSLAANCGTGAGTRSSTIQKKAVSGPAVALAVNPLECDLELNKTCCITQPVLPDLDSCDGKLERLVLEYTGDKCSASDNNQGGHFQCLGHRRIGEDAELWTQTSGVTATPHEELDYGDTIELTHSSGEFGSKTKLKVFDSWWRRQYLKLDTSCERAIGCGDQFGAFKVVGIESTLGGVVDCSAPPPPPQCAPNGDPVGTNCDDRVVDMVFEYVGQTCQDPLPNPQNGHAKCSGDATGATDVNIVYTGYNSNKQKISPSSGVNDGDLIRVSATASGGCQDVQSLKISTKYGLKQKIEFKASCDKPLRLGDEFGSLRLVEFTTKSGFHAALGTGDPGPFESCEVPLAPPGPHCTSDLRGLTLVYIGNFLGAGCSVSNPTAFNGACGGAADPGDPVEVTPGSGLEVEPADQIEFGDLVTFTPSGSSLDMPSLTNFTVTGAGGTQNIQIKTSCYKPLALGDRFGSFVVFGMDREEDGPVSLGGNVQYQYTVTNPNASTVDNIEISDDQLGVIASGVSIPAGESETFTKTATLFGTTTNVATASGDVSGDFCAPGVDQVTVGVLAPPQGSFSCTAPIQELTVIWNGAQTVDVKAWAGTPGVGTLLGTFDDVEPGEAITVTGLGGPTPTFEIFDSTGTTLIGKSQFKVDCSDQSMNGLEDCSKENGNLKDNVSYLINDWLLEGMVDSNETLACTPGLLPSPPACGFGPELVVLMPGLLWWYRRRQHKQ